jgi:hypothetical protein
MGQSEPISTCTSKRRWPRFSLKSLLVTATLLCIWLGVVSSQARRQQRAVTRFRALGGQLGFDYQRNSNNNSWRPTGQIVPAWIRGRIGEDYFRNLVLVYLNESSDAENDDLKLLQNLPALEVIELCGVKRITDDGLVHLAGLNGLKVLSLSRANMEGSGLRHIRSLHNLVRLSIDNVSLIDEDLEHLQDMPSLTMLSVANTHITDQGLQKLSKLHSLVVLDVADTKITDAGLKYLETLTCLQGLRLNGTHTTAAGRTALKKLLPNCQVNF